MLVAFRAHIFIAIRYKHLYIYYSAGWILAYRTEIYRIMSQKDNDDKTQNFVSLAVNTEVGHYRIIKKIGAGGMGEVFLAQDTKLDREVALKFLPSHLVADKDVRTRFTREARAAAKLNHPNIVVVHEVSEFNGRPYFAMEHVKVNR